MHDDKDYTNFSQFVDSTMYLKRNIFSCKPTKQDRDKGSQQGFLNMCVSEVDHICTFFTGICMPELEMGFSLAEKQLQFPPTLFFVDRVQVSNFCFLI